MTTATRNDAYGRLTAPDTLTIQRLLPGSVERLWTYLTESDLRRQWLAAGKMEMKLDAPFELVWRNHELTASAGKRPAGFAEEHRMISRIIAFDPPRRLVISWGENGEVSFDLEPRGEQVLLTLVHRRIPDRDILLKVSPGWHAHLDVLSARLRGQAPEPFWDNWRGLRQNYEKRLAD
jgi:uncharacterized protein YndB with AHSA1/START domain